MAQSMSSRLGLGRFQVVRAFRSSGPGPMSSRSRPSRCRVIRAQDVEWSRPGSMLNRVGLRQFASKLSQIRPSSSQVSLCSFQNGFNVVDKVDLI